MMQEQEILDKFKKKGFNHLSLEDLAVVQQSSTWTETFKSAVGEDWGKYSDRAVERLTHSNFNVKWITRSKSSFSGLFSCILRGDIPKLLEFLKACDLSSCRKAVDNNNKSAMHLAAREGQLEILRILVEKGWDLDCTDKHLTTPLHQACNAGHVDSIEFLLENGADPALQDSLGRNALLYSVCAPGSEAVEALLRAKKEMVLSKDYTGRNALHYAVFNPHPRQCEIMKVLVEKGLGIDTPDDELKTSLHHACEAGKAKAIRWLMKWGASTNARDRNKQTPLDLAASNNIKKLLGLNSEIYAKKLADMNQEITRNTSRKIIEEKAPIARISENKLGYKEKLLEILYQVQEAGINNKQHLKKPQLYSGNWMEGIFSPIALFNELSYCTPSEAVIKIFNVIFPYSKSVAAPKQNEIIMDEFFGGTSYTKTRNETPIFVADQTQISNYTKEIDKLKKSLSEAQESLKIKEKAVDTLEFEWKKAVAEVERNKKLLNAAKDQLEETIDDHSRQKYRNLIEDNAPELKTKLEKTEKKLKELYDTTYRLEKELKTRPTQQDLDSTLEKLSQTQIDNQNLRFKSGQIFLRGLEKFEEGTECNSEIYLQDIEVLKRLEDALKKSSRDLKLWLQDIDSNKDCRISKSEATKLFTDLNMVPQDVIVLLRVLGYRQGNCEVSINTFINNLEGIEEKKTKLQSSLFQNISNKFKENSFEISRAFEYLDVNRDGVLTFAEFSEGVDGLKLNINREEKHAVFAALDADHNGTISLHELQERLEADFSVARSQGPKLVNKAQISSSQLGSKPAERIPISSRQQESKPVKNVSISANPIVPNPIEPFPKSTDFASLVSLVKGKAGSVYSQMKQTHLKNKSLKQNSSLNANSTKIPRTIINRLNGSLMVGLIRSKGLPRDTYNLRLILDGSEKALQTPSFSSTESQWLYKDRLRVRDTFKSQLACEITAEVYGSKGQIGTIKIGWHSALDFPNIWAIRGEYLVMSPTKKALGSITVQLMWVPKDTTKMDSFGNLGIILDSFAGIPQKVLINFAIKDISVLNTLTKGHELLMKNIFISADENLPVLKCTVIDSATKQVIFSRNLSLESALASTDWTKPFNVDMEQGRVIGLKLKWNEFTKEDILRLKSAIKLQAWFRGQQQRKAIQARGDKKRLARTVMKSEGKYYIIIFSEIKGTICIDLHIVSQDIPLYDTIDNKFVGKIDIKALMSKVRIEKNKIVLDSIKEIKAPQGASINKGSKDTERDGKLIGRKIMKVNSRYYIVSILDQGENVKIGLNLADDNTIPMYQQISNIIIPKIPIDHIFSSLEISSAHQMKLNPNKLKEVTGMAQKTSANLTTGMKTPKIISDTNNRVFGNIDICVEAFSGILQQSLVQFAIADKQALIKLVKDYEFHIKGIETSGLSQPMLKCTLMKSETKEIIAWRDISIEPAIQSKDWTKSIIIQIETGKQITVKIRWSEFSKEHTLKIRSAIKLQAWYRGHMQRKALKVREDKKRLKRKVFKTEGKYYILVFSEVRDGICIDLHVINDKIPLYEIIDSKRVGKVDVNILSAKVKVEKNKIILDNIR